MLCRMLEQHLPPWIGLSALVIVGESATLARWARLVSQRTVGAEE